MVCLLYTAGTDEALSPSKGAALAWTHRRIKALHDSTHRDPSQRLGSLGTSSSLQVDAGQADLVSFNCSLGFPSKAAVNLGILPKGSGRVESVMDL